MKNNYYVYHLITNEIVLNFSAIDDAKAARLARMGVRALAARTGEDEIAFGLKRKK